MGIKVLFVYPNSYGMNMLPPAIALFSALLKRDSHKVFLFDSTDYRDPTGVHEFNSDKTKEENLNARPFDDVILRKSYTDASCSFIICTKRKVFSKTRRTTRFNWRRLKSGNHSTSNVF